MRDNQTLNELGRLYKILEAGEKGYGISAVNVSNNGLKVLFKSFAQQRARFKSEIVAEMQRLGGEARIKGGLLPAIHRGRITIFAALTISKDDREKAVLKEILIGEKYALKALMGALKKDMPHEIRVLIERQFGEIYQVVEQVKLMRGREGKRLVIRLFDTKKDAESAVVEMENAGLHPDTVEQWDFNEAIDIYQGKIATITETIISGAVGGAFWGGLIGIMTGIGMQAAGSASFGTAAGQSLWAYLALAGILAGEFVGSILGFAIGVGLSGEDAYQYELSIERGKILLLAMVDALQAPEAGQIMSLVNIRARGQIEEATA